MSQINAKMRQVLDRSAAVWAGMISGIIFLMISMLLADVYIEVALWSLLVSLPLFLGGLSYRLAA